jgi:ribosomal protein S18 acetylase RimI-like enzyme
VELDLMGQLLDGQRTADQLPVGRHRRALEIGQPLGRRRGAQDLQRSAHVRTQYREGASISWTAMTLPEPLLGFWQSWYRLSPNLEPTSWGVIITDPRYPLIYDANQGGVLFDLETVDGDEILKAIEPALREAGAAYRHVEFWGVPDACPAFGEIASRSDEHHTDVDMVFEAESTLEPPSDVVLREVDPTDSLIRPAYRQTYTMYGDHLGDDVVEQMDRRFYDVIIPSGLRMFAAFLDDEVAGFVNLMSLDGIGYLDAVVTLPSHRGRGVATAGVLHVVRESLGGGDRLVHLLADEGEAPQRLYERLGFRVRARVSSATTKLPPPGS